MKVKEKILEERDNYKEDGAGYWTPYNIRLVRNFCLGLNSNDGLCLITMILVSIYLFLRFDEFHRILFSSFITNLHIVDPTKRIRSLAVQVQGKSDCFFI